jgi:hypothetical protein
MVPVLKDSQDMKIIRRNGWYVPNRFIFKRSGLSLDNMSEWRRAVLLLRHLHANTSTCYRSVRIAVS